MPKPKEKKAQRAAEATPTDSASRVKKTSPKKKQAPATATAPSGKPTRRTRASKCKEARLPGPFVEPATSESETDTPNPDLITGDEDSPPDSTAPRATKTSEGGLAAANTSADTHDQKGSASATPPAKAPQKRSPTPEDGPDPVDYGESEPDQDREQGEVPDPNSSPQLTEQQRVTHPDRPMNPKTAATVARVEAQTQRESHRDTASNDRPEQQIITNAGIDEGFPGTTAARQPRTSQ
ncbi:unnamed protein product [Phytophthora fragariaefolia]|uniref:Unnamed protein product n=1 Tax=Phytophthora fragariaefolia TaxID=1490495 RepID=A0A9W6TXS5_9STRA|nr:unnamed protein product [Phytophthora fragariaefolia]